MTLREVVSNHGYCIQLRMKHWHADQWWTLIARKPVINPDEPDFTFRGIREDGRVEVYGEESDKYGWEIVQV